MDISSVKEAKRLIKKYPNDFYDFGTSISLSEPGVLGSEINIDGTTIGVGDRVSIGNKSVIVWSRCYDSTAPVTVVCWN